MVVYVVTDGEYSDYHIEAVFTDKEQAELYCATHNLKTVSIEEYDTEEHKFESATPVYSCWNFHIEEKMGRQSFISAMSLSQRKRKMFSRKKSITITEPRSMPILRLTRMQRENRRKRRCMTGTPSGNMSNSPDFPKS